MSHGPDSAGGNEEGSQKPFSKINRKKLDHFLSSICESAGMSGPKGRHGEKKPAGKGSLKCQGPCEKAEWRAHLDIDGGVLCVSADWSANKQAEKHRDVVLGMTYRGEDGKAEYHESVFCDAEVRWLLETLWHAPIWS